MKSFAGTSFLLLKDSSLTILAGYIEGGLFAMKFKGPGNVAITTFFDPLVSIP